MRINTNIFLKEREIAKQTGNAKKDSLTFNILGID